MDTQAEAWQKRLDADFPQGVIATDIDPDADLGDEDSGPAVTPARYLASRVTVLEMATPFSPQVQIVDYRGMASKDVTSSIETYVKESPSLVRVTFTDGRTMRWNADVPEKLARRMKEPS